MKIIRAILTLRLVFFVAVSNGQDTIAKSPLIDTTWLFNHEAKCLGKQFGQFNVRKPNSKIFSNSDFANKVVFINFWFKDCHPCIAELDGFNKLYDTLKNRKDFLFVSFTFDPDSTIRKIKNEYNIKYKVFHIEKTECYRLNFDNGFPASFILDKNAIIKYFKIGGATDTQQSTEQIMTQVYSRIIEQL